MKLITRDTDYAIRALVYIAARKKAIVSVKDLVKDLKIPRPFLRKILQKLNKHKLLKSYKGKGGGFKLAYNPEDIHLTDLIKIFQGDVRLVDHVFKKRTCQNIKTCVLKKRLDVIEKHMVEQLKDINIALLMKDLD